MTPEQWQQVRDVLHDVVQVPANQRSAYLDVHCAGDPALRWEVEQLLAAESDVPTSFLESPAVEQLPPQTESKLSGTVLAAGTKLGPYVVQGLIGAGGMGEVYKKSAATIRSQCCVRNSFQVVFRSRSGVGSIPGRANISAIVPRPTS